VEGTPLVAIWLCVEDFLALAVISLVVSSIYRTGPLPSRMGFSISEDFMFPVSAAGLELMPIRVFYPPAYGTQLSRSVPSVRMAQSS